VGELIFGPFRYPAVWSVDFEITERIGVGNRLLVEVLAHARLQKRAIPFAIPKDVVIPLSFCVAA